MNFICFFLFNFLVLNGCLSANIGKESSGSDNQHKNSSESQKFNALNEEFGYQIFDSSNLDDILQLAKNPQVSEFVKSQIFPVKYQDYDFYIIANNNNGGDPNIVLFSRTLHLNGHDFYLDVIKNFGESIHKLRVFSTNLLGEDDSAALCQRINDHCSESLTSLYLGIIHENTLAQFKKPFSNIESLYFHLGTKISDTILPFNEIFPKLKKLSLTFFEDAVDNEFYVDEWPQLEDVYLRVENGSDVRTAENHFERLLQKNPQIRILNAVFTLGNFISTINEHLPNLEFLTISILDSEIEPAQLDHVKHFSLISHYMSPFERLTFPRLEKLELMYTNECVSGSGRESWISFFKNHQNIRKLNCTIDSSEGLADFLVELPNLDEVRIITFREFDVEFINQLIVNQNNLFKFQLENEWNITHSIDENWSTLLFEKIN